MPNSVEEMPETIPSADVPPERRVRSGSRLKFVVLFVLLLAITAGAYAYAHFQDRVSSDDANVLKKAEGRWPWYPNQLLKIARKHGLQVPGMGLPGPRETWNRYRTPPATTAGE